MIFVFDGELFPLKWEEPYIFEEQAQFVYCDTESDCKELNAFCDEHDLILPYDKDGYLPKTLLTSTAFAGWISCGELLYHGLKAVGVERKAR